MKTCTVDDCSKPHRARGLCVTHYNRQHQPNRYRKVMVACTFCGAECEKYASSGARRPFCSYRCRDAARSAAARKARAARKVVPTFSRLPFDHSARLDWSRLDWPRSRICTPECGWCGARFVSNQLGSVYCSHACSRRHHKMLRKGRERGATGCYTWAEVMRRFMAMDRRCAYCQEQIDGHPEPDHVLALSRGGSNSITNILPSCRQCNLDKSDMTLDEWAESREMRGLPSIRTDFSTAAMLVIGEPTRPRWSPCVTAAA